MVAEHNNAKPVGIGIIGLGFAGTHLHLPPLMQNPRARIVHVADSDVDKVAAFDVAHPALKCQRSTKWQDVVIDKEVEAVFVLTPTSTHAELTAAALQAGKHVMCEKPVALTLADAQKMMHAAQEHPRQIVMIAQVLRFWDDYVKAHRLVESGRIGQPAIARSSRSVPLPGGWFAQEKHSGGVIMDLSLHDIDFLVWTLGNVDSVFAQGANCCGSDDPQFIDYAHTHLNFTSGAIAHVEAAWATTKNYPFSTMLEISGSNGMLSMDNSPFLSSLEVYAPDQPAVRVSPAEFNAYFHEDDAFLQAVQTGGSSPIPVHDVIHALQVVLAAKQSVRQGAPVKVEPLRETIGAA